MTDYDCLSLCPPPLTWSSRQRDEKGPMLPCSGRGNRGAENEGAEPRFEPWCPAVGEVMALTSRLGCLLSEKLLWREENPGGESGLSFKQRPPTAQAGARAPPGVLEAPVAGSRSLAACLLLLPRQADRTGAQTWVQILALLLTFCVTLGKLLSFSEPQFLPLYIGDANQTHVKVLPRGASSEMEHEKYTEQ